MADIIPHDLFRSIAEKEQDLNGTDVVKVCLLKSTYTPSADHTAYSDVSGHELAESNGYSVGGTIVTMSVADSDSGDKCVYDISDPSWLAVGGTLGGAAARYAAVYNYTVSGKNLIYVFDLAADKTVTDGHSLTVQVDSAGLFSIAQV